MQHLIDIQELRLNRYFQPGKLSLLSNLSCGCRGGVYSRLQNMLAASGGDKPRPYILFSACRIFQRVKSRLTIRQGVLKLQGQYNFSRYLHHRMRIQGANELFEPIFRYGMKVVRLNK